MAIPYLPTEIFELIITHLSSMKIWRFDNARKRDLQSLRLVSRRIEDIATPFLFENLRTDVAGLLAMTLFCNRHPELARHIHGLQLVLTPIVMHRRITEVHDNELRIMKEIESQDEEHAKIFFNIILEPLEKRAALPEVAETQRFFEIVLESITVMTKALPNLEHFEPTSSKSWSTFLTNGAETFYNQTGRMIHNMELDNDFLEMETRHTGILGVRIAPLLNTVGSYKCDYTCLRTPFFIQVPDLAKFFSNLHTLDLGFRGCTATSFEDKDFAKCWIPLLNRLSNLSTLRLVLTHSMPDVHAAPNSDNRKLFLDDLFLDWRYVPNDQDDGDTLEMVAKCKLAKLKSVTFKNWAVTASGLHYFLYAHKDTLTHVDMEQVSLRIPYKGDKRGWSFIARACQKHLPSLEDLRLSKLHTHEKCLIDLDPTAPPGPPAVIRVRKLQAKDYADLGRIAFDNSGDRKSGAGSKVEECTWPVSPETEWWWPEVARD